MCHGKVGLSQRGLPVNLQEEELYKTSLMRVLVLLTLFVTWIKSCKI